MGEPPKIEIPLDLPDVRVVRTRVTAQRELIIEVESSLTSTTCRRCGGRSLEREVPQRQLPRPKQRLRASDRGPSRY
jgi:hypothetical protein